MSILPKVAVVGGGTGTYVVLQALRKLAVWPQAIMSMLDDGGSNKVLRDEFGLLPTSGIRQAIIALSQNETLLRQLFMYRYHQGEGISGMTFGNLFMAALSDILHSQEKAIHETAKLLQVKGDILPISYDDARLFAKYANGVILEGEHAIDELPQGVPSRIVSLWSEPSAKVDSEAEKVLREADHIILGPGDLYTNTIASLIVEGVPEAIMSRPGRVWLIMNLMTKASETYEYSAGDFIKSIEEYLPTSAWAGVIINNNANYPQEALQAYLDEKARPIEDDLEDLKIRVVRAPLVSGELALPQAGDLVARSLIRHDPDRLSECLANCILG